MKIQQKLSSFMTRQQSLSLMLSSNLASLWSRVNMRKDTEEQKICNTLMDFTTEQLNFNLDAGRRSLSLENTNRMVKLVTRI